MALLITDVLSFLEAEGLINAATGWTGAAGYLPPAPDQVIAVFETTGLVPELTPKGSAETAYDEPGFQVRGRGDVLTKQNAGGYDELRQKMGAIYRALHGSVLGPATGDPAYVLVRSMQSGPLLLGLDENNRFGMTWNFETMRERES